LKIRKASLILIFFPLLALGLVPKKETKTEELRRIVREWSAHQEKNYPPEIRNYKQFIKANLAHLIPLYEPWVNRPSLSELEKGGVNPGDKDWGRLKIVNAFQMNGQSYVICRYDNNVVLYEKTDFGYSPVRLFHQGEISDLQLIKPGKKAPPFLLASQQATWDTGYNLFQFQNDGSVKTVLQFQTWRGAARFFDSADPGWMEMVVDSEISEFPKSLQEKIKRLDLTHWDIEAAVIIREMTIYKWDGKGFKKTGTYTVIDTGLP